MEVVTDKWGIRISRIEIRDHAAAEDPRGAGPGSRRTREAGEDPAIRGSAAVSHQHRRRRRAAAVRKAQGNREAAILRAEGNRQAAILEAEGRSEAITTVYSAIKKGEPDPTLVAILQLDAGEVRGERQRQDRRPVRGAGCSGPQTLRSVTAAVPGDGDGASG
jgi:regulator of protease activity HflC (stomatin/prohibitin superfamily)